jgi:drug/metabolite transporter (DMT)-like permease
MKKMKLSSSLMLFMAALIWGFAFAFQSQGMDYMGPMTFNGTRFLIGAFVLVPVIFIFRKPGEKKKITKEDMKVTITGGVVCGLCLFAASSLQQVGIQYTSVGKAGFLTTLYIILVPIIGIFFKKKASVMVWIGAILSVIGMYLLCVSETMSINKGDVFAFCCAIVFAFHILSVDYFSPKTNGIVLSCIQFLTSGLCAMVCAFIWEQPTLIEIINGIVPLLYVGIMSSGVAYTLQILGQKNADPTIASLIMSLESAVSVLGGWMILGQKLSPKELLGCLLMFIAVIGVQVFDAKKENKV